jgi:hypothetical protein
LTRSGTIITIILIVIVGIGLLGYRLSVYQPAPVVINENATFSGNLEVEGDTRYHSMRIYDNVTGIHFTLNCGWNDFDLYGRYDNLPSRSYYDFSGINSGGENFNFDEPKDGILHLMVYSYTGTGHYDIIIEFYYD